MLHTGPVDRMGRPGQHDAPVPDVFREAAQARRIISISHCFERFVGRGLVTSGGDTIEAMWNAPCVILAHGLEADPVLYFGNQYALDVFEMDLPAFLAMPSRLTAEAPERDERQRLLDRVRADGFIDDYSGVRISATGRKFRIEKAIVWNVVGDEGRRIGQAAAFSL